MLGDADKSAIRRLVGNLHVSVSNVSVAKTWLKKARKHPKETRKEVARYAVACHVENRNLYRFVMRGGF